VKAVRIVQVVVLVLVAVYLAVLHAANPERIPLPGLISMPISLVLTVAIVAAWLTGWLPSRVRVWRLERKLDAVRNERDRLLEQLDPTRGAPSAEPVIPDRVDPRQAVGGGQRRGDDPTDYL
jgi:uncharacterized integral membrane protein